jgi:hypothetical protein
VAELSLTGHETAPEWSGSFHLMFRIELRDNLLRCTLRVRNTGEGEAATFWQHALQHTYYATPDVTQVRVVGLKGLSFFDKVDKVAGGDAQAEVADSLSFDCNVDRIYLACPQSSAISMSHLGIAKEGNGASGQYTATMKAFCGFEEEADVSPTCAFAPVACCPRKPPLRSYAKKMPMWLCGIHGCSGVWRKTT